MGKHKTNTAKKAGPTASATVSRTPDTIDPNVTLRESSTNWFDAFQDEDYPHTLSKAVDELVPLSEQMSHENESRNECLEEYIYLQGNGVDINVVLINWGLIYDWKKWDNHCSLKILPL